MTDVPKTPLPSFREQLAIVYDDHMATLGGGERSALAYALALKNLDFTVEILAQRALPDPADVIRTFGAEFRDIPVRQIRTGDLTAHLRLASPTVFVNHTFMDFHANPARVGIYSQMFPVTSITSRSHPRETRALSTYQLLLSNSSFTKKYSDATWEFPTRKSHVLHPPIGQRVTDAKPEILRTLAAKKKQFVHVGRFNPGTHNKNQQVVIETFLEARNRFPSLNDWRLLLIGNANQDSAARSYLAECKKLAAASGGTVEIRQDAPEDELFKALAESFGYVHATGAFLAPGVEPFKCEHLGLSIIEGMASGCIPIVYARGGIFDVLEPGKMGVPYMTRSGLIEAYQEVVDSFGSPRADAMQRANVEGASTVSFPAFQLRLAELLTRELTP